MLKHQLTPDEGESSTETATRDSRKDLETDFGDLEEELDKFSLSLDCELKQGQEQTQTQQTQQTQQTEQP